MRRLLIPALASALCFTAAPSSAKPSEIEVRVSFADLDLARSESTRLNSSHNA